MIFKTPHSGRMPTTFYWMTGLIVLVTGIPILPIFIGDPWPGKTITLLILLLTFIGITWMFWYYARYFGKLYYELGSQGVAIHWGRKPLFIPYDAIKGVEVGQIKSLSRIWGFELSKYRQGIFTSFSLGKVHLFSIGDDVVYFQTEGELYGISPKEREAFLAALYLERDNRRLIWQKQVTKNKGKTTHSFFRDGWSVAGFLLGIGLLLGMALHIYLIIPQLPEQIPVHYNLAGEADRYGSPQELYIFPAIALLGWLPTTIIGISFASYDRRIGRYMLAISNGVLVMLWCTLLSQVLVLLP